MWSQRATGVAHRSVGTFPNPKLTVNHVINTALVYVWNVRQRVCIGFYMGKVGGWWWGDSWQCELRLNCRRECTERLETVGVKQLQPRLQSVIQPWQWSSFQTFLYALSMTNILFFFFFFFFLPQAFSHHIQPLVNEDAPPLADETHCIW